MSTETIVRETVAAREAGFKGAKVKVGLPHVSDDVARLKAVRAAVGEIMVDANCFTLGQALRRAPRCAEFGIAWFEEPLPADDIAGHARLAVVSPAHELPIAVGESLYSPTNSRHIPHLDAVATSRMAIVDGHALVPEKPGLGIEWDWAALRARLAERCEIR